MSESGERSVANIDIAGEYFDGDLVVEEGDFLVGVTRGEGEVEGGVERCVGEVESGELKGINGEGRAVGAVEDVEHGSGDGGD